MVMLTKMTRRRDSEELPLKSKDITDALSKIVKDLMGKN